MKIEVNKSKYNLPAVSVIAHALKTLGQPENLAVNVSVVSEKKIRQINSSTRGIDKVTDVLSFPMLSLKSGEIINPADYPSETDLSDGSLFLGDIVVCAVRAKKQAEEYGHIIEREFGYLILHGLLHLLGYDHQNEYDKIVMRAREEEILSLLNLER